MNPYQSPEIIEAELVDDIVMAELVDEGSNWPIIAGGVFGLLIYLASVLIIGYR